jgi:zinc ribbon protein
MFCPKCATQNADGVHFCRACGANISLVPQALTGQLPAAPNDDSMSRRRRRRRDREPTLDEGIRTAVMGCGFLAVALALAFFGNPIGAQVWWFWMLIPAFAMLGKGISDIVRVNQSKRVPPAGQPPQMAYTAPREVAPHTGMNELRPPVTSVTEGTTRHLGTEAATKQFDSWESQKRS